MTKDLHPSIRFEPDMSVDCTTRSPVPPELKAFDRKVGGLMVRRWSYRLLRLLVATLVPKVDTNGMTVRDEPRAGRGARIVTPDVVRGTGAVFMIHGGGYVIGSNKEAVINAVDIARDVGVPVICPSYGLAPQEPFPVGLNDLMGCWKWLLENAESMGIDPAKIVIGGISAGGGLAATMVQRIHDEGGVQPAGQLLIYPMLDDRTAMRRELDKPRHRTWCNTNNRFGWTSYLGHAPGASQTPEYAVAARREDLSGLPPAWIGVGTLDVFLEEDREYARRLSEAAVDVSYVEVAGGIHGFDMAKTEMGKAFTQTQIEFLRPLVT